jgi:hypothetical protein
MKLFGRSSGYYLFWTGFVYFWVSMYFAFTHYALPEIATLGFVLALSVPLWCPPVARYFNMEPLMFDLFKRNKMPENVVPFPVPAPRLVEPPAPKEKDPSIHYTIGHTSDNRVAFRLGYSTLMMNYAGVQALIDQLEFFQSQLHQDTDGQPN